VINPATKLVFLFINNKGAFMQPIVFLPGKLVNLCLLDQNIHLDKCLEWLNDHELTQYLMAGRFPCYIDDEKKWFENNAKPSAEKIALAIHVITSNEFIGIMGLEKIDLIHRTAMTGSFIGSSANRGQGYGHDAKMILLNHAFNRLNLRKVSAGALDFNQRSLKFNQSCGYKIEGRLIKHYFVNGEYHDEILLAVFAEDFNPLWQKYCQS
jgi:RimJ/RimL family protein N-acetyltransferase